MTIDEAMTDLSIQLEVKRRLSKDREANAIKLGIEALKRLQACRTKPRSYLLPLLPGETHNIDIKLSEDKLKRIRESPLVRRDML